VTFSILLLSRYGASGASSRQRFYLYGKHLAAAGIEVTVAPFFDDAYLAARYAQAPIWKSALAAYGRRFRRMLAMRHFDLIWIEKEVAPFLPAFVEGFALGATPYIVDYDDAWFLRYRDHPSVLMRTMLGTKLETLVRGSAGTVVGNEYLARWARAQGAAQVTVLPTVVDLRHYASRPMPEGPFTIGWIGTPVTAPSLYQMFEPLRRFCAETNARLLIIGADQFTLPGVECVHATWSEPEEAALLSRCHIGIMPLPQGEWSEGKCSYKLIQYMASERPVIASSTEANRSIVAQGPAGLIADSAEEWYRALKRLHDDAALRQEMAQAGRRAVERHYCLEATAPRLIDALMACRNASRHEGGPKP